MTPKAEMTPDPVDRRRFLQIGTLGMAALAEGAGSAQARAAVAQTTAGTQDPAANLSVSALVDVNVSLSHWPFRRLRWDETLALAEGLQSCGVTQAWAGSFDALLHRDITAVNIRLSRECSRYAPGFLIPFGAVNPRLPDWEEDLRRCQEEHGMPGIRLHPNYHGYTLDDPEFARLLDRAAERRMIVQIALTMEDERTQHPLVQVPHVDARPLAAHARRLPELRLVLINAFRSLRAAALGPLAETGNVLFDIAMLESVGGVAELIRRVPVSRVLFGSHAPFYYFRSAQFKIKESALEVEDLEAITNGNAKRILS